MTETNQADEHSDTLAVLQNLLKLKLGKPAAVEQWKELCVRGLMSEKYPVRLSALEQLAKLADSGDAVRHFLYLSSNSPGFSFLMTKCVEPVGADRRGVY